VGKNLNCFSSIHENIRGMEVQFLAFLTIKDVWSDLYTKPLYPLNKRLEEPQNRSGHFGKQENMSVTGYCLYPVCNNRPLQQPGLETTFL